MLLPVLLLLKYTLSILFFFPFAFAILFYTFSIVDLESTWNCNSTLEEMWLEGKSQTTC